MENLYNIPILTSGNMSGNLTSTAIKLAQTDGYAVSANWTGSPVGSIKLQASLDGTNWVDITPSIQAISGSGNFMWNVGPVYYDQMQVVYTFSSGTGTLNVSVNGRDQVAGK